jgi:hypothetical protein
MFIFGDMVGGPGKGFVNYKYGNFLGCGSDKKP